MSLMRKLVIAAGCAVVLVGGSVGVAYAGEDNPSGTGTLTTVRSTAGNYTRATMECFPYYGYGSRARATAGSATNQSGWSTSQSAISAQTAGTSAATSGYCEFR
jgi:hypothetical protein